MPKSMAAIATHTKPVIAMLMLALAPWLELAFGFGP